MINKKKVLVVEDEPIIAADVSQKLDQLGYSVPAIAVEAEEAYLAAEVTRPDVVLMDINLNGTADGIEAATRIYSKLRIPVVFLTAHDDLPTLRRAQEADPFGYLTKPAASTNLANSIEIALQRFRKQDLLRLKELWLEAQLESVGQGLIAASQEGTIRFINAEGQRLLARCGAAVIGKPFHVAVPLRHRLTGQKPDEFVRLTLLQGATTHIGDEWMVDQQDGRKITGELAIAKVGNEAVGVVFTFRDNTVELQSGKSLWSPFRRKDEQDCVRMPIQLDQVLPGLEQALGNKLLNGSQLQIEAARPVLPILGSQALLARILNGLVEIVREHIGRAEICVSTFDLDIERYGIDGSETRYVRLRFAYRKLGSSQDCAPSSERSAQVRCAAMETECVVESLSGTARVGSNPGWTQWDFDFPAFLSKSVGANQSSPPFVVILVEPNATVREVVCSYLTGDVYECFGARDVAEALDWVSILGEQIALIILPPELSSIDIQTLRDESGGASILLVTDEPSSALTQCAWDSPASISVIDKLFSKRSLREKLDSILAGQLPPPILRSGSLHTLDY